MGAAGKSRSAAFTVVLLAASACLICAMSDGIKNNYGIMLSAITPRIPAGTVSLVSGIVNASSGVGNAVLSPVIQALLAGGGILPHASENAPGHCSLCDSSGNDGRRDGAAGFRSDRQVVRCAARRIALRFRVLYSLDRRISGCLAWRCLRGRVRRIRADLGDRHHLKRGRGRGQLVHPGEIKSGRAEISGEFVILQERRRCI